MERRRKEGMKRRMVWKIDISVQYNTGSLLFHFFYI